MQGTQVWALVREDPNAMEQLGPCATTAEPVLWGPRATTTEARVPRARAPQWEATAMRGSRTAMKSSPRRPQLEKDHVQQQRHDEAKNK